MSIEYYRGIVEKLENRQWLAQRLSSYVAAHFKANPPMPSTIEIALRDYLDGCGKNNDELFGFIQKNLCGIPLGEIIFEFSTFQDWRDNAVRRFQNAPVPTHETIALDSLNRVCSIGRHFMIADDEKTFPVKVYILREDSML